MKPMGKRMTGRALWVSSAVAAAAAAAMLRGWQMGSAFETGTGLTIPGSQASVILLCVLVMAGAWFVILSIHQAVAQTPWMNEEAPCWDLAFLDAGDLIYPMLEVAAAFLALLSAPVLLAVGMEQFRMYREMLAAQVQLPSNNGVLTIAAAAAAFLGSLGLLQTARRGLRPGRRDKGDLSAVLPGVAGCMWLMETFRGHAANPVLWDYAPQLVAIVLGMGFYMDYAGMYVRAARPRRLLWLAGMTMAVSAAALGSTAAEVARLAGAGSGLCSAQLGDLCLLLSQTLAAAGVLWRLPANLEYPPDLSGIDLTAAQEIQEETRDE